ncbi:hypothetical protein Tco_0152087 [Tanacetum coccineum]
MVELLLEAKLPHALQALCEKLIKYVQEKQEEKNNVEEQAAKVGSQYWNPPIFYDDDDDDDKESSIPLRDIIFELPLSVAIAPYLPITDSLIMEDEHLNTILETESDEENEYSVKDLNLTQSESEDLSNNESDCDVSVCDDSSPNFTAFSNPLFDSNGDFTFSDDESFSEEDINPLYNEIDSIPQGNDNDHFNAEYDIIESLLNRDTSMVSSPKIDSLLKEFSEEDIRLVEKLLYDNSSPRPPEELNSEIFDAIIESFSLLTTKVVDDISDNSTRELYVHVPNVLPTLYPVFDTLLPFSSENEDKVFNPGILISKEEKSPHLLSHRGFKVFQLINDSESPMMIYGGDIPILDVPYLHFYPP